MDEDDNGKFRLERVDAHFSFEFSTWEDGQKAGKTPDVISTLPLSVPGPSFRREIPTSKEGPCTEKKL